MKLYFHVSNVFSFFVLLIFSCSSVSLQTNDEEYTRLKGTVETLNSMTIFENHDSNKKLCDIVSGPNGAPQICCDFYVGQHNVFKCLPNLIVVGTQKAGTTALYYQLVKHYQVRFNIKKELHLVNGHSCEPLENSNQCTANVRSYLLNLPQYLKPEHIYSKITVDADPFYVISGPKNMARVLRTHFPAAKIVLMVRDPVYRFFSSITMLHTQKHCKLKFSDYVQHQMEYLRNKSTAIEVCSGMYSNTLRYGYYDQFLENLYAAYPKEDVLVLEFEQFKNQLNSSLVKVFTHARLDPTVPPINVNPYLKLFSSKHPHWNRKTKHQIPDEMKDLLASKYQASNERFFRMLGERYDHWTTPSSSKR